ncbi:MAG: hypothetical protein KIT09_14270 [Bryobacteraceae bacterium]|nr:hypothetical protein [Bryobacteraceae bacterium]
MKVVGLLLCFAAALGAEEAPNIFFSRTMPGAVPAYAQVTLQRDGRASYRESVSDPDEVPLEFQLRKTEVDEIFDLAAKLDHFRKPLESGLKVANMGMKVFRYESGGHKNEVKFNYSQDPNAALLADWFARIIESEQHFINLERTVRFDKLGVNQVLLRMQASLERNRLVAYEQFLPLLDRVVANQSYLNMARDRAGALAAYIRSNNASNGGNKGKEAQ